MRDERHCVPPPGAASCLTPTTPNGRTTHDPHASADAHDDRRGAARPDQRGAREKLLELTDDLTLGEARRWLWQRLADGSPCPCCKQMAREYRRPMTHVSARAIIALWREHGEEFGHLPTLARTHLPEHAHQGGYLTLGHHWRLIEPETQTPGTERRAGWWRITARGRAWISGHFAIPRYARIFNNECLELVGERLTVDDVLGTTFDRIALLGPRGEPVPGDARGTLALFAPAGGSTGLRAA